MNILKELAEKNMFEAYDRFERLCASCERTQLATLQPILDHATASEFGEKHGFTSIADVENYKSNVPISSWSDYETATERMRGGERNILFKGAPVAFISTSGTSGRSKLVPESETGALAKNVTDKLRRRFTVGKHHEIMKGKILPLVNPAKTGVTPGGIPFGTASGLTLKSAPPELLTTSAYPIQILDIPNDDALDYALMRFALESDVRMIIGNNIARMEKLAKLAADDAERIISDIAAGKLDIPSPLLEALPPEFFDKIKPNPNKARELNDLLGSPRPLTPAEYWPNMKVVCCWLSGSVGASVAGVRRLFDEKTEYLDYGYGASEGKFNIPTTSDKSSGALAIHAGFYEFIPADSEPAPDLRTLLAHQLEDGKQYRMIITNFSGLYRYDMKDIVRVDGFTGDTPNILFVSKRGDIGNVAGEKLAGSTIAEAAATMGERLETTVKHIAAVPRSDPPRYVFCVELDTGGGKSPTTAKIAETLDDVLNGDIGYRNKRRDNLLKPPEALVMRPGWLEAIYKSKKASGAARAQTKLPVIHESIPFPEFVIRS